MTEIKDIKIVHKYLIALAAAVSDVLEKHNISLIMAYGTMLGAIRHKGFIPWDDDMDFYVPFEKYGEIYDILSAELKYPYEIVSYKTNEFCHVPFYKVQDVRTCLNDSSNYNQLDENIGINIDLFPITLVDPCDPLISKYKKMKRVFRLVYVRDIYKRWYTEPVKKMLRLIWPISEKGYNDRLNEIPKHFKKGDVMFSFAASQRYNEMLPSYFFKELSLYSFENFSFWGPKDADGYLRTYFGNYMELPPEDKRIWHADGVYEKEPFNNENSFDK